MVITRARNGWIVAELMFALSIVVIAMIPLAFSFRSEQKLLRAHYQQVIAMEIIDGEMEMLHAGQWREYLEGAHDYRVTSDSATNLPPGKFMLQRTTEKVRLEWRPRDKGAKGILNREISIPKN